MKKQILITSADRVTFREKVNEHLERGWLVVPGTLNCSISTSMYGGNVSNLERWAVVLEHTTVEDIKYGAY